MDPAKSFSGLDPKLQETYNRIMNAATPQATQTPTNVTGQVTPPATQASPTADQATAIPQPTGAPVQPQGSVNPYGPQTATVPVATAPTLDLPANTSQSPSLIKMLYIVGAVIFFIAYTVFWIKIFNLPIPLPF